jgi:hypothetical protein
MALTTEQQAQVDVQVAISEATQASQMALQAQQAQTSTAQLAAQHANQIELQAKQTKLEAVRLAKEVLIENARSKAVDSRDVAASDITAFASTLVTYVNS